MARKKKEFIRSNRHELLLTDKEKEILYKVSAEYQLTPNEFLRMIIWRMWDMNTDNTKNIHQNSI